MKRPARRLLVTLVALVCMTTGVAVPASAGTLTGATFSAPSGWNSTGASNARYDWGFATATTSTLSKVTASVPPGTGGKNRYLALSGDLYNSASTPDSTANSITGDLDLRASFQPDVWPPTARQALVAKWFPAEGRRSYMLNVDANRQLLLHWSNGSGFSNINSGVAISTSTQTPIWVRATLDADDGAGNTVVRFYTSSDGSTWNQLGITRTFAGTFTVLDSSEPITIGAMATGASDHLIGRVYYAEVRNGINGPVVNKFDPNEAAAQSPSSWSSSTGETWTINRSGTNSPADIATDLGVGPVEGLPGGGSANYRFIDGVATYNLPTPTTVNAGTNIKMNLGGFTNTATPGSYASTITTYNGTTAVDSATTGGLSFMTASSTTSANVVVDPSLRFTVSGRSGSCSTTTLSPSVISSGSALQLGRLSAAAPVTAAQTIDVASNARNGYLVYVRASGPMNDGRGNTIANVPAGGFWSTLAAFPSPGTDGFGYKPGWLNYDGWAPFSTSNREVFSGPAPTDSTGSCLSIRAQAGSNTPAGSYSTSVIYTAVARY